MCLCIWFALVLFVYFHGTLTRYLHGQVSVDYNDLVPNHARLYVKKVIYYVQQQKKNIYIEKGELGFGLLDRNILLFTLSENRN